MWSSVVGQHDGRRKVVARVARAALVSFKRCNMYCSVISLSGANAVTFHLPGFVSNGRGISLNSESKR